MKRSIILAVLSALLVVTAVPAQAVNPPPDVEWSRFTTFRNFTAVNPCDGSTFFITRSRDHKFREFVINGVTHHQDFRDTHFTTDQGHEGFGDRNINNWIGREPFVDQVFTFNSHVMLRQPDTGQVLQASFAVHQVWRDGELIVNVEDFFGFFCIVP